MLGQEAIDAFNSRLTVNVNNIKSMTVEQLDRVKQHGNIAEGLLKNKDLALFFHQTKFDILDRLSEIKGHTDDDNNLRVALGNQLSGLNTFIDTLKTAVYHRNTVVKQQTVPTDLI